MNKKYPKTNPWHYTEHKYITPEDIQAAINFGTSKLELLEIVMEALADGRCEDSSCCAFVAHRFEIKELEDE